MYIRNSMYRYMYMYMQLLTQEVVVELVAVRDTVDWLLHI
jgi:hypothetical protein